MSDSFVPLETVEQLLTAARREGLELTASPGALDAMGLDFLVCHARDAGGVPWVVRTPRRADVIDGAAREAKVLALVRRTFPAAIPDWRVHAPDVIAYPRIAGTPAITLDTGEPVWNVIDPTASSPVFRDDLAAALVALQAIGPDDATAAGVRVQSIADGRAEIAEALVVAKGALAIPDALLARWQRWLDDDTTWPAHLAMSHGDLHPGHLLLDAQAHLVGVLDWTEGRVADPSIDFAMLLRCFGQPALEDIVARFERQGGRTWPGLVAHTIERVSVFPALGAAWAIKAGNTTILEYLEAELAAVPV